MHVKGTIIPGLLLRGKSAALRAAKVDEDIALLVGRAASLIEDAPILPPEDVTNRAKRLVVPLGVAVEKLNEKEKWDGINRWKNWLDDVKDKGLRRAHKFAKC